MHLHWKHRELVKIIFKGSLFEAERTAKILEGESGGVLVGIIATSKGYAILFYRGKHYERPSKLRPRNLLTKRQALERSIEMQRKRVSSNSLGLFQACSVTPLSNMANSAFRVWSNVYSSWRRRLGDCK